MKKSFYLDNDITFKSYGFQLTFSFFYKFKGNNDFIPILASLSGRAKTLDI